MDLKLNTKYLKLCRHIFHNVFVILWCQYSYISYKYYLFVKTKIHLKTIKTKQSAYLILKMTNKNGPFSI